MNFEISFGGKICNFVSLYHSPSQSYETFEDFADNLELNLDKIGNKSRYLLVVLGDFNVKSSNLYKHDKTTYESSKIDAITCQFGLPQLIKEPTHILTDSSSCIELLLTSQPNLVMESGVHSSLHKNSHYQIIYAKINFKVFYRPPYEYEIWHYQRANVDQIQRAIEQFSWEKSFRNLNVNEMVSLFSETIKNILSNYIPHETITCDDKDPLWFNKNIKQLIQEKNSAYKSYILSDKNLQIFERVKSLQNQLKCSIKGSKKNYYLRISKKLMVLATSAKTYWSILKTLLNNKKIPCIPPLFHQGKYVTDFKKKAELFNSFFAK